MDTSRLERIDDFEWRIAPFADMRVPAVIYADEDLVLGMDEKVFEQVTNVARLPGIVKAAYAMPDAHWGYGFPIGGVAAFDPDQGGVVSAGGVGFDISCGVRCMPSGLSRAAIEARQGELADALFAAVPAGVGSHGKITLSDAEMTAMLSGGAVWALARGYGREGDLERIEEQGCMPGARPEFVSDRARKRQRREMGTLGSGNHYLEVQEVTAVHDTGTAAAFGLELGEVVVSIHCGSRGLGHQIGTEFLRDMVLAAQEHGIALVERELACASRPIATAVAVTTHNSMDRWRTALGDLWDKLPWAPEPLLCLGARLLDPGSGRGRRPASLRPRGGHAAGTQPAGTAARGPAAATDTRARARLRAR